MTQEALTKRIEEYLSAGGLFNPELANHVAVRDLLIECREALRENAMREVQRLGQEIEQEQKLIGTVGELFDDKVIAHRKLDRDLLVYTKERNT